MIQNYSNYTNEDQEVWRILFKRQHHNLENKVYTSYLTCLQEINSVLNQERIPDFNDLNNTLTEKTGWKIKVVAGIIPVDEFLALLSQKIFCSSTWIRDKQHLDYLKEPDMFHDIFGHIPLLVDEQYSSFTQAIGKLGVKYAEYPKIIKQLEAFYWFTIEFGVMKYKSTHIVYGAGLISSYGETNQINNEEVVIYPYDLQKIINHQFDNSVMQNCYYAIADMQQLYESLPTLENIFNQKVKDAQRNNSI